MRGFLGFNHLNNFSGSIFYEDFESELKSKIKCVKSESFLTTLYIKINFVKELKLQKWLNLE